MRLLKTTALFAVTLAVSATAAEGTAERSVLLDVLRNPYVVLFAVLGIGLAVGQVKLWGISLGSSAVLFVALAFGHFGLTLPAGAGTLGLVMFIYCLGIGAGPSFFTTLARRGTTLARVAVVTIVTAGGMTILLATLFHLPTDLAVGLLAGALTSTPALAAAMDALKETGPMVSVGYGIAYPFGVIGVVLFVQLLPRFLKADLDKLDEEAREQAGDTTEVVRTVVKVANPAILGKQIAESTFLSTVNHRISRRLKDGLFEPLTYDAVFEEGQVLLMVGDESKRDDAVAYVGVETSEGMINSLRDEVVDVVVTSPDIVNKAIGDLHTLRKYGVTITRITRNDVTFVPTETTVLDRQDVVKAVGDAHSLREFARTVGHSARAIHETDLLSLSVGMLCGVVLGLLPISIGGGKGFTIGLAGGPLFVGLLLGHYGRIGPIVGRIPYASRSLMMELGVVLFLANAGVKAGGKVAATVAEHGISLFLIGALVTIVPMALAYVIARLMFKLTLLECLGGICGSMTSTPALGAVKAKTSSQVPIVSYAAAYPVALILMILGAQIVIRILG